MADRFRKYINRPAASGGGQEPSQTHTLREDAVTRDSFSNRGTQVANAAGGLPGRVLVNHVKVLARIASVTVAGMLLSTADAKAGQYGPPASVRLQIEPRKTEVFIDGYYMGAVDDFDGFFQRLRLDPGEHDIELYLEGHRSVRQRIYLQPGATFRIRHTMQPLKPGEVPDARPVPPAGPPPTRPADAFGHPQERPPEPPPIEPPPGRPRRSTNESGFGTLAIRVQPGDAEVLVDGERWEGPSSSERLVIQVPAGEHRVEIRKSGFETYTSTLHVRDGETTTVNVSLARE
jgi:PEGA domain